MLYKQKAYFYKSMKLKRVILHSKKLQIFDVS